MLRNLQRLLRGRRSVGFCQDHQHKLSIGVRLRARTGSNEFVAALKPRSISTGIRDNVNTTPSAQPIHQPSGSCAVPHEAPIPYIEPCRPESFRHFWTSDVDQRLIDIWPQERICPIVSPTPSCCHSCPLGFRLPHVPPAQFIRFRCCHCFASLLSPRRLPR